MNTLIGKAQEAIQHRLLEIKDERKRLEQALRDLQGVGATSSQASARSSSSAHRSNRAGPAKRQRGPSAKAKAQVSDYLQANPGASTAEVVAALGLEDGRVVGAQRRKLSQP